MADLNLQVGAYGWLHAQWQGSFYPDDLPPDWALSYYSNELNTVMVPASYWRHSAGFDCENWLDNIHDNFYFYVECPAQALLDEQSFSVLLQQLNILKPHLAGVVIGELPMENRSVAPVGNAAALKNTDLNNTNVENLHVEQLQAVAKLTNLYSKNSFQGLNTKTLWLPRSATDKQHEKLPVTELAIFYDDLTRLRESRTAVEQFVGQFAGQVDGQVAADEKARVVPGPDALQQRIIVRHELLNAADLIKFRSVVEIMGL